LNYADMDAVFHPRSIALAGITVANPEHWTRTFLDSLLKFKFEYPFYLVNRRGGEIGGRKVYRSIDEVPCDNIDYVIGTVSASATPGLVDECAGKGVKVIHFFSFGFSETGEEERARLEIELAERAKRAGIRVIGPNCMGIYCPESRMSFQPVFPRESGSVGFISQSGGHANYLVRQAQWRGVRFSKSVSYGNACDLNESDFLEYLTEDADTRIIALYVEGVRDGKRFRQALQKAAEKKVVVLLKGGMTEAGGRAAAGHTGALAGTGVIWDSLCKQLGVIRVDGVEEMGDVLVTLLFMPLPAGRRVGLVGFGGGVSVLITDTFDRAGLKVPALSSEIMREIREFTPPEGNILRNPVDYSQTMLEVDKLTRAVSAISRWNGLDFMVGYFGPSRAPESFRSHIPEVIEGMVEGNQSGSKPLAMVIEQGIVPGEAKDVFDIVQHCVSLGLPVYYSFDAAANAINKVLSLRERRSPL